MGPIWLLIGLVLGAVAAAALVRRLKNQDVDELRGQLADEQENVKAAEAARAAVDAERVDAETQCRALELQMANEAGELNAKLAKLEADLEGERKRSDDKVKVLTEASDQMVALARQSAGQAVAENGKHLVDTLKAELRTAKTEADADLAKRQKSVEETVAPVKDTLARMAQTLEKVDQDRRRSHAELSERLKGVTEATGAVLKGTTSLDRALRQPNARGRWGELHLRRLVELAGMSPHSDFTEQFSVDADDGRLRPDLVVHLPGAKDVVVDSKVPLAPYLEACNAEDDTARKAHMQLYARGLRAHVKKLAAKDYSAKVTSAADFVVLYLPGEHYFSGAVECDATLIEDAITMGVHIASPTTLIAMLKTIAYAWQQEKVAEQAQHIAALAQALYEHLARYLAYTDVVSKRLNSTVEAQNQAMGCLEGRVLPTARKFPDLGVVSADRQLSPPRTVDATAREVQAKELSNGRSHDEAAGDETREAA